MGNSRFKFRAWDIINEKMYPVAFPTWNGAVEGKIDFVNHTVEMIDEDGDDKPILMQFTGLLDKNGKEIYEGDILEVDDGDEWQLGKAAVVYERCRFGYKLDIGMELIDGRIEKVIGNIYENPELLEPK